MRLLERPEIVRPRVFPAVGELILENGSAGTPILSLGESPFRLFKKRGPANQAAAALWLFCQGLRAELDGKTDRADFFWEEMDAVMKRLTSTREGVSNAFRLLVERESAQHELSLEAIVARLIDEVFIDVHLAFYNASAREVNQSSTKDRANFHLDRVKTFLSLSDMSPLDRAALLRPALQTQFDSLRESNAWNRAADVAAAMLELDPNNVLDQDRFVDAVTRAALKAFSQDNSPTGNAREAAAIQIALQKLDSIRPRMPFNEDLYTAMSQLHHMRAIRLANSNQLPQALLSSEIAVTIQPNFEEGQKVRSQLIGMMSDLQEAVKKLEDELSRQHNASLTAQGLAMQRQARTGYHLLNDFVKSALAIDLAGGAENSRRIGLWQRLGLRPPDDRWAERAATLFVGLTTVLNREPADRVSLDAEWRNVIAEHSDLAAVETQKVTNFLAHRLFDEPWEPASVEPAPLPHEPVDPPLLATTPPSKDPAGIPFRCWIYSGQDRGMKVRWAMCLALIAVALWLGLHEWSVRAARNAAFADLDQAASVQDAAGVLAAADRFLSAPGSAADPRRVQVISAYRSAIVDWFNNLRHITEADRAKIARFQTLTATTLQTL